jgi:hypothetical protein
VGYRICGNASCGEVDPSEMEKEAAHRVGGGYVGAPANPGVIAPTV